jgi:hypothetical protein
VKKLAGGVALSFAVGVLTVGLAACGDRPEFDEPVSFRRVERTLTRGGLDVCRTLRHPDGFANQAVATRTFVLAADCSSDDRVRLVVDRFDDADARDAAVRNFEVLVRPRGDGAAWTWGPLVLHARGERDDTVMERIGEALDGAGAA